jgi:hypothetical protein
MYSRRLDLAAVGLLVGLPIAWFNRVLVPSFTGKTLLPFDNLYAVEPWHSLRPDVVAYNPLISDLVLESVPWVLHTRRALAEGQLPLWNADVLGGVAFLAGGQNQALYPGGVILDALPLADAFGWFIALHMSLAGIGMYALGRALGLERAAALLAGVAFMLGGYFVTSATFPQVIAAAAWTPLLLAIVEVSVRRVERRETGQGPWLWLLGAMCVGMQVLAGHIETSFYGLLTVSIYAALRVGVAARRAGGPELARAAGELIGMVVIGAGLAGILILPLLEALGGSARVGARSASEVADLAWSLPQLWTVLLPDLFGNPTHRSWLDLHALSWRPAQSGQPIFWGTKNYVEGGQYLGILSLLLAVAGVRAGKRTPALIFAAIALLSLLMVLGSPLFLLLQAVPGADQLRSPFRWVFPFSIALSMLAGLGLDALLRGQRIDSPLAMSAIALGGVALGAVLLGLVVSEPFLKLSQRFVTDPAWAERAFGKAGLLIPNALPSPEMFWGYESQGLIRLGLVALASAAIIIAIRRHPKVGAGAALGLLTLDLFSVQGSFFPATDVGLSPLSVRPPVVEAIEQLQTTRQPWRFTTFERGDEKTFLANTGMYYAWQDVRGYDSIIPRQYATYTQRAGLAADSLAFNRIAPVYNPAALGNLLSLLNVRYVLTEQRIDDPAFREVYRDAHIAAYENETALPRSFVAPLALVAPADQQPLESTDPRDVVYLETDPGTDRRAAGGRGVSEVLAYGTNQVTLQATLDGPAWVVLADTYAPGWHATAHEARGQDIDLAVFRAYSTLRAVSLPGAGEWTVKFTYLPDSFKWGALISGASVLALLAVAALGALAKSRTTVSGIGRSAPSRPLRAPCSPAGRAG